MKIVSNIILLVSIVIGCSFASATPNSEVYVTVQSDDPTLKYREGQQAGFSIYETTAWTGLTEVDAFFNSETTPLTVTDMATFRYIQTPILSYGPASVTFNVYEIEEETRYVLRTPKRTLLETFDISFNVRYNDSNPPTLAMLPEENTVFIDDMPFLQVDYADSPAGIDLSTFKAHVIDEWGTRTEISSLFTVASGFATIQFDELHKLPIGTFFLEIEIADYNENVAKQTYRYEVEIPVPTTGFFVGQVLDNTGAPVEGADVSIAGGGVLNIKSSTLTDVNGKYKLSVGQGGNILLRATKAGWTSQSKWTEGETGKDTAVPTFTIKQLDPNMTFISKITGGVGTNADGSVEFHIQPNAASDDIYLNITQAKAGNELPGALPILSEFTFMGTMGPSGTTFSPPGKLRIKNDHGFPAGTPIVVGMFNKDTGVWEDSGHDGVVSPDGQFVEYDMPHFSSWDANQPVVPPVDQQPQARSENTDQAGTGCKAKGCRIDVSKGNLGVDYELPGIVRYGQEYKPTFTYWSQSARPQLFASAEQFFRYLAFGDHPDLVQVEMRMGKLYKKVFYKGKGDIPRGDTIFSYNMMLEAKGTDGLYMPTGLYDFNVNIGNDYKNSRFATALYFGAPPLTALDTITPEPVSLKYNVNSRSLVLNSRNSAFGKGWTMQGLEKITPQNPYLVVWEDGTGMASAYTGIPTEMAPGGSKIKYRGGSLEIKNTEALNKMNVTSMIEENGSIFVADCPSNKVYVIGINGNVSVVAGTGAAGYFGDGGLAKNAQLSCPSSVFATADGGLLIADKNNARIRKVSSAGIITTIGGNGSSSESQDGGAATQSAIGLPTFVSQDKLHSVHFITGNKVRFIDPRGRLQTLVASDNAYYKAELNEPSQIGYDERDNILITDKGNNRVVKLFLQSGDIRILAGNTAAIGKEKLTRALSEAANTEIVRPIAYLEDKKLKISYVLNEAGKIYIISHDGRLIKTQLEAKYKSLVLSRNAGLIGIKSGIVQEYISPAGDFSRLVPVGINEFMRIQQDGTTSSFNGAGLLTSRTTRNGKTETFAYDNKGRLQTWTIPSGESFEFTYDLFTGRLKEVTDPVGRVTKFSTNSSGQLTKIENPEGGERLFGYDSTDLLTSETDEENKLHQYVYSSSGLLTKEIYADGSTREIKSKISLSLMNDMPNGVGTEENPADIPIINDLLGEDTSAAGREMKFRTDKFGNIIESINGLGHKTQISRNDLGLGTRVVDSNSGTTNISYNSQGQPTSIVDQDGNESKFEYWAGDRVSKITDPLNRETTFTYDTNWNLIKLRDPLMRETNFEYGPKGLPTKISDATSAEVTMTYNNRGLLETLTDPAGKTSEYTYNSVGLLIQMKDALNRATSYEYDNMNRLVKITDALNGETLFTYSPSGKLMTLTDPKGQATSYAYDDRGMLISMINSAGQVESYTYDPDGLPVTKSRRDGSVIEYTFDEAKRLVRVGGADTETKFNYDRNGNLTWISNKNGTITRSYSLSGLLMSENQKGYIINYTYNAAGTRKSISANGNNTHFYYNGLDILSSINANINGQTFLWSRELDLLSRPTKDVLPNGVEIQRTFDNLSRLEMLNNLKGSQLVSGFAYAYNDVGNRISKTENVTVASAVGHSQLLTSVSNFNYDNLDRLSSSTAPNEVFVYDSVGNRQFGSGTSYNTINQILSDGGKYIFEYNLNGDMIKKSNQITGQEINFIWNSESQLISMQIRQSGNVIKEIFYKYDGLGRRIERQVSDYIDSSKSHVRRFYYDGENVIEDQDLDGRTIARYMYGPGIDDPILMSRSEGNFFYTKDGLGSIKEMTKTDGSPIQRYRYTSYGVTSQELIDNRPDKGLIENRYAYTGRELEDETGLYYYRSRYYDPELGRFISEDTIGLTGMDSNLMSYVGGNPINRLDPNGEDWTDVAEGSLEFLVGVGDSASFGATEWYRNRNGGGINMCSPAYQMGKNIAMIASIARMAYAGTVRAGAMIAKNGTAANAFRNNVKQFMRGGDKSKSLSYEAALKKHKTDAGVKYASGKTNPYYNTWYGGMGIKAANGEECLCQ